MERFPRSNSFKFSSEALVDSSYKNTNWESITWGKIFFKKQEIFQSLSSQRLRGS